MKETDAIRAAKISDMQRGQGIEGFQVVRDLEGSACAQCGSRRYFLVFHVRSDGRNGTLAGCCSRCRKPREVTAGEIEQGCHN